MKTAESNEIQNGGAFTLSKGNWIFLFMELLLFSILLLIYSIYFYENPAEYKQGAEITHLMLGVINSFLLITALLCFALSIRTMADERTGLAVFFEVTALVLGILFIINIIVEWNPVLTMVYPPEGKESALDPRMREFYIFGILIMLYVIVHVAAAVFLTMNAIIKASFDIPEEKKLRSLFVYNLVWIVGAGAWLIGFPIIYIIT